jgi:hypothetical protein
MKILRLLVVSLVLMLSHHAFATPATLLLVGSGDCRVYEKYDTVTLIASGLTVTTGATDDCLVSWTVAGHTFSTQVVSKGTALSNITFPTAATVVSQLCLDGVHTCLDPGLASHGVSISP